MSEAGMEGAGQLFGQGVESGVTSDDVEQTEETLPDLEDVPDDVPATPEKDPGQDENDHPTGEAQAQENREREPPA